MDQALAEYVVECVKPSCLSGSGSSSAIPRPDHPEFFGEVLTHGLSDPSLWKRLIEIADRLNCASPFLAGVAEAVWFAELDEGIRLRVEERLARERLLQAVVVDETATTMRILGRHSIPVIVVKGVDLGTRVYPDPILRPMADADLLVPPERYSDALHVLGKHGYRLTGSDAASRTRIELSRRPGLPVVKLHSQLLRDDGGEFLSQAWGNSEEGLLKELAHSARVLSESDYLVYLIRHGAIQHLFDSPVCLNDIHFLIEYSVRQSRPIDWEYVQWALARARSLSAGTLVFGIVAREWGTSIPSEAMQGMAQSVGPLRRLLLRRWGKSRLWFSGGERSRSREIGSRYLLRDGFLEAIHDIP